MTFRQWLTVCAMGFVAVAGGSRIALAQTAAPAPATTGPVTSVTLLDVLSNANVPQNVENSNALLQKLVADSQKLPGAVSIKVLRESARSNHFIILAVWQDMKSYELYTGAETTRAFRQAMGPRMGGPFDERLYIDLK